MDEENKGDIGGHVVPLVLRDQILRDLGIVTNDPDRVMTIIGRAIADEERNRDK